MSNITAYRKLLGVSKATPVQELKVIYRNLMKEWHPDKFATAEETARQEAEARSKELIEAYNFLVSVAPETIEAALPQYTETINASPLSDFNYSRSTLTLVFQDGSSYEYFDVPKNVYVKLINSDTPGRFCRRHVFHEYVYRKVSRAMES